MNEAFRARVAVNGSDCTEDRRQEYWKLVSFSSRRALGQATLLNKARILACFVIYRGCALGDFGQCPGTAPGMT